MFEPRAFISRQLRRPTGVFGRAVMTRLLNRGNTPMIEATLERLDLRPDTPYLDVGFGGGLAIRRAAERVSAAPLYGTDYSADVVVAGQRRLRDLIAAGRLTLLQADAADMPLRDGLVQRISTTNTVYFLPDLDRAMAELHRLLGPGGELVIGYTGADKMTRYGAVTRGFTLIRAEALEASLAAAGFVDVETQALRGPVIDGDFVTLGRRAG